MYSTLNGSTLGIHSPNDVIQASRLTILMLWFCKCTTVMKTELSVHHKSHKMKTYSTMVLNPNLVPVRHSFHTALCEIFSWDEICFMSIWYDTDLLAAFVWRIIACHSLWQCIIVISHPWAEFQLAATFSFTSALPVEESNSLEAY